MTIYVGGAASEESHSENSFCLSTCICRFRIPPTVQICILIKKFKDSVLTQEQETDKSISGEVLLIKFCFGSDVTLLL